MSFRVLNQRAHQGVNFVEVEEVSDAKPSHAGPLHYAVPGEFEEGSLVDIAVTQVKTAEEVEEAVAAESEVAPVGPKKVELKTVEKPKKEK